MSADTLVTALAVRVGIRLTLAEAELARSGKSDEWLEGFRRAALIALEELGTDDAALTPCEEQS